MKEFIKKNYKILIVLILIMSLTIVGITLAREAMSSNVSIVTGTYNVEYSGTATLPTTVLEPVFDSEVESAGNAGKVMKVEFTVKSTQNNPTDIPLIYDVALTNLNIPKELQSRLLKWRLYKNTNKLSEGSFSKEFDAQPNNRMVLTEIQQDLPSYYSLPDSYTFYVWISEECVGELASCTPEMNTEPLMGKQFSGEIRIELSTKEKKNLVRYKGESGATLVVLGLEDDYKGTVSDFSVESPKVETYKPSETLTTATYNLNTTRSQYYVTYASDYTFDNVSGTYTLNDSVSVTFPTVYTELVGKYISNNTLSNTQEGIISGRGTIYKVTSASYDSSTKTGSITYTTLTKAEATYNEDDIGIFSAPDDLGTSYFFRGNVENNYVFFGGRYWRIIRINGDGSIRMIYDGTSAHANGVSSTDRNAAVSAFSSGSNDNTYVGYMSGTAGSSAYNVTHSNTTDSPIKTYLEDTWYPSVIGTTYESYLADAIYCNDRSISNGTGTGIVVTNYKGYERLISKSPSLICSQSNDRFTLETTNFSIETNGKLDAPVGLITADEIAMAGGISTTNSKFYLYSGTQYWTMTPYGFFEESSYYKYSSVYSTNPFGVLTFYNSSLNNDALLDLYARPVISLKSTAIKSGTGTMTDPFKITE